jgi:hypothetical protein
MRDLAPSSSGLGLWLLKPATRVRIPSGLPVSQLNFFGNVLT